MSFLETRVCFSSNFVLLFSVMRHSPSALFHLNLYVLWRKGAHQSENIQTFGCSPENFIEILMLFFEPRVSFSNFASPFIAMTHNSLERGHSKSTFIEEGKEGHWKANKNKQGEGSPSVCVRSPFLKKMLKFSKWSFIVIHQFLLLSIMAVWNIKQTIMKDYNNQSC